MVQDNLTSSMVTLHFTYYEIIDSDWTAIDITVLENDQPVSAFRNYAPEMLTKEIYGNQSEAFQLPDLRTALTMIHSNKSYHECSIRNAVD